MIGGGYVGLVSAACFSEFGWTVTCVDKDTSRVAQMLRGISPIYEPGLEDLMIRNMKAGRLGFTEELAPAVRAADVVFLAVGTPMRRGDGFADLSHVFTAVEELAPHLDGFTVITTKSTVPVGTSREIERRLKEIRPEAGFAVCSNPEFLREGSAIQDFTHPDRVLIGTDCERARAVMERLYKPLAIRNAPIIFVGRESAELAKYTANAFLAMKISFINEIGDLCEEVGADIQEVADAIGRDKRIGEKFLHPGPGYGGSCFPKDVSALIRFAREARAPVSLIEQVERVNHERKIAMVSRIERLAGGSVRNKTIAVLGVTFKPNTDDMREAPSIDIVHHLMKAGAKVRGYDPVAMEVAHPILPDVVMFKDPYEMAKGCDGVIVVTEWNEFKQLDLDLLKSILRNPVIFDGRNIYDPESMREKGFIYRAIGRGFNGN
jgi:UDPglucose 6-dehydrogenase